MSIWSVRVGLENGRTGVSSIHSQSKDIGMRPEYNCAVMKSCFRATCYVLFLCALGLILACGTNTHDCDLTGVRVSPQSATANHSSPAPANSQQFTAFGEIPEGCAIAQSNLTNVTWSVSDTQDVSISNTHDQTYGLATCINATSGPVTVTGTAPAGNPPCPTCPVQSVSGTARLTCQ